MNKSSAVFAFLAFSLLQPSGASAEDGLNFDLTKACAADDVASACVQWMDLRQLAVTQFSFNGLSLSLALSDLNTDIREDEESVTVSTTGAVIAGSFGWQYRIFDENLDTAPAFGDPFGLAAINILEDDLLLSAIGFFGDSFTQVTSGAARDLSPVGIFELGAHAQTSLRLWRSGRSQLIVSGLVRGDKTVVASPTVTLPKGEFDDELELVLTNSRALEEGDVEAAFLRGKVMATAMVHFGDDDAFGIRLDLAFPFAFSEAFDHTGLALDADISYAISPHWLELHLGAKVQKAFDEKTAVFLLPSLGGAWGMRTRFKGNFANTLTNVGIIELGPPFLRAFYEVGASGGVGEPVRVDGSGVVIDFAGLFRMAGAAEMGGSDLLFETAMPEIVFGFNDTGFVFNIVASGQWEF